MGQAAGRAVRARVHRAAGGFAACEDPAALQAICDRLGPGTINVFTQRWLHRLPLPFTTRDHDAGYWWETSMRQVEVSRTIVFDAPRHARGFFEALVPEYVPRNIFGLLCPAPLCGRGFCARPRYVAGGGRSLVISEMEDASGHITIRARRAS